MMLEPLTREQLEDELAAHNPKFYENAGVDGLVAAKIELGIVRIVRTAIAYLDRAEAAERERDAYATKAAALGIMFLNVRDDLSNMLKEVDKQQSLIHQQCFDALRAGKDTL